MSPIGQDLLLDRWRAVFLCVLAAAFAALMRVPTRPTAPAPALWRLLALGAAPSSWPSRRFAAWARSGRKRSCGSRSRPTWCGDWAWEQQRWRTEPAPNRGAGAAGDEAREGQALAVLPRQVVNAG